MLYFNKPFHFNSFFDLVFFVNKSNTALIDTKLYNFYTLKMLCTYHINMYLYTCLCTCILVQCIGTYYITTHILCIESGKGSYSWIWLAIYRNCIMYNVYNVYIMYIFLCCGWYRFIYMHS